MHPVSFAFKRGHWRAVVAHGAMTKRFGITPARFDALYVIRWKGGSCFQSDIWQELDLHPSTISRMLKAMEKIGLVARQRDQTRFGDQRQVCVCLTRKGFDAIVGAIKAFLRSDELRAMYNRMHAEGAKHIAAAVAVVRNIGEWLRDRAVHPYPVERPDVAAGERYDAVVEEEVDRLEEHRIAKEEGLRGFAALAPTDDPMHPDYFYRPEHRALAKTDPGAWERKIMRDLDHYATLHAKVFPAGEGLAPGS